MEILLIVLVPAVVAFFIAVGTEGKVKTTFAALIAAAIGVVTGNPIYMALDVAAVGLAYWLAMTVAATHCVPYLSPDSPLLGLVGEQAG